MSPRRLSRTGGQGRAAAPVRIVHLGLGNFFRAHPCWYTEHSPDACDWGFAAFAGRDGRPLVDDLTEQQGLFTLVSRAASGDRLEVVSALSSAHAADDNDAWLACFGSPALAAVTITVTEAGYLRGADGGLDVARPQVQADLETLRQDPTRLARTAPGRLVAGMAARRRAGEGPMALVPCDNTPGNGELAHRVVHDMAALVDKGLATWFRESVSVVTTMVDRITPRTQPDDVSVVLAATGVVDRCPVVTEPFHEWVLSGSFPSGRPQWDVPGARFTDDVTPYERRKLWLLNGAHSLLAYAGGIRGHATVAEAVEDDMCRTWLQDWWQVASSHLDQPPADLTAYRAALTERFTNARMHDRLDRIAADGSQKLPIRIVPVLLAERSAGRVPVGATRVLAAWVCHLRGLGAPVNDARAADVVPKAAGPLARAVPRVLGLLDAALSDDADVVNQVIWQCEEFVGAHRR